jgi:hypothetical protein
VKTLLLLVCLLLPAGAWACDLHPAAPGVLLADAEPEANGLVYRAFDTNNDGVADYKTATQTDPRYGLLTEWPHPLFYWVDMGLSGRGWEQWIDTGGEGRCQEIVRY